MAKAQAHEKAEAKDSAEAPTPLRPAGPRSPAGAHGRQAGRGARPTPPGARWRHDPGLLPRVLSAPLLRASSTSPPARCSSVLGVEYKEVPDWTCCGSTPAHMMDHLLAQSLAARNLRQAAEVGDELLAPCPSCYQREKNARDRDPRDDAFRAEVNEVLDKPYDGKVMVYALPEYLMKFVGEEKIASLVKTDLSQLKVVPYYGCLLGRPSDMTRRMRQRAAHDDGPAAAGRRRRRQVVELQDRVLRRQRGHAQGGDPAAAERQGHRAGAGRPGPTPSWCAARSATSTST